MKTKVFVLFILIAGVVSAFPQGLIFHGGVRNSVYSYESEKNHTRVYQYSHLSVSTADRNIRLNTSFRFLTDVNETLPDTKRFLAYDFYVRFSNLANKRMQIDAGRQFLHPGTPLGALDGVKVDYNLQNYSVTVYGGYQSNYLRNFDIANSNAVGGGYFQVKNHLHSRFQLLYLQKNNDNATIWQLGGLNTYTSIGKTNVSFEGHYDFQNSRFHRILLSARQGITDKLRANAEFKQQQPQVYANSYFTIFQVDPYTQYRFGLGYNIYADYYVQGQVQHIQFDGESAERFFLYLNNPHGSIGMSYDSGYAGDQLSLMFDYAIQLYEKFTLSAMVDYSHYRTEEIYEYENQLGNGLRLNYRLNSHLSVDVEYQWLNNQFKESDNRFLNHILYRW